MTRPRFAPLALVCAIAVSGCGMESGPRLTDSRHSAPSWIVQAERAPLNSVHGDRRNAIAWAPLADPDNVTVEGSVPSSRAWSTSKVLVVAAYLDAVVHGDPGKIPPAVRASIHSALSRSDDASIKAIHRQIPDAGAAMTKVLRSIGDRATVPTAYEGTMQWSIREQVRFMAALGNGRVVSRRASYFLLHQMQPIAAQRWGLGTIGARAFKPGWMSAQTESRQMGIVGDFAVAIITTGGGPPAFGAADSHAIQLTRLARLVAKRIADDRCLTSDVFGWTARWCFGLPG